MLSQIGVYALSIFLPPLGLWPGIKYLRQKGKIAKIIGLIAIVLTIIATGTSAWFLSSVAKNLDQQINSQLNRYQNLGL
ncbi:hypothetical protein A2573_02550 [Candidatus Woesebacteria bacterium RIFOXYD1_FULL_43_18]|uniref:DUF5683 domain-containing protein n=1 Tax=Candidatus Woesebacteria bacterium RIFOXYD1_FULL_43_18 TaxID=1802551 RepID=A0A1F8DIM8_9BACT|nr:MAG: hypothetical protein A2573_02550 [Candidatus Woesebacteria bacterium RIFOXYD1_FULL_43_18]